MKLCYTKRIVLSEYIGLSLYLCAHISWLAITIQLIRQLNHGQRNDFTYRYWEVYAKGFYLLLYSIANRSLSLSPPSNCKIGWTGELIQSNGQKRALRYNYFVELIHCLDLKSIILGNRVRFRWQQQWSICFFMQCHIVLSPIHPLVNL